MEKHVITVMADPKRESVTSAHLTTVNDALVQAGARVLEPVWLSVGEAADLMFFGLEAEEADRLAREALGDVPLDLVSQPSGTRRKQLLISDMDSTIITVECIDELADFAGLKPQVAAITECAMNGELDFKSALRERVALLAGLPESILQEAYSQRVTLMPGAKALVGTMRSQGAHCLLVSVGFTFFTSRVRETVGFHDDHANLLEIVDGKLSGKVMEPILDRDAKLRSLLEATQKLGLSLKDSLAVGDGANDLPMIMAAGLGVAYHAKPVVRASAGAQINYCDLSALLFLQGYNREDFIDTI